MKSIAFPEMFKTSGTQVSSDHEATLENLKLALLSYRGELFGDPEFGSHLAKRIYSSNNSVLVDTIIDDIYTTIKAFVPQVTVSRSDIGIVCQGVHVYVNINATNNLDYTTDLYNIRLTKED